MFISGMCLQATQRERFYKETVESVDNKLICIGSSEEFRAT